MSIQEKHFEVAANDLWEVNITLRDKATQVVRDLTGATVRLDVRTAYDAASPSLQLSIGSGITVPTPTNGEIQISALIPLAAGIYVYDLQYNFGSGPKTKLRGRFKVLSEVTQGA